MPTFVVLTGGPGAGKTTLIEALARTGHHHSPESGRDIIRDQTAINGRALPWDDVALYAELMLAADLRAHTTATTTTFFDRGIVDTIGYLRLEGRPVPAHFITAAHRSRYDEVFVAPFWPDIYTLDTERTQTPAIAAATCDAITAAYREFGYAPVALPLVSVEKRCDFVLRHLGIA